MAQGKTTTVKAWRENNKTAKSTSKTVEAVVVDNQLVADIRDIDAGVFSGMKLDGSFS